MKIKFGKVTSSEIEVMLTASADSGNALAMSILGKSRGREFSLTIEEAEYLRDNLYGDADRVSEAVSESAGRAFEESGNKLDALLKQSRTEA